MQLTPISQHHEVDSADLVVFSGRYAGFGKFQMDLQRQELFLEGHRVKRHAKVYQALTLLLNRAGEIVTREEVRKQLWPDTFLASPDANVNRTMNKLRQVLGDALENPQYIETIRGRGYRFIAHVQFSETRAVPTGNALRANAVAIPPKSRAAPDSRFAVRAFALKWPNLLRLSGVLVAGMLLGALLTFVWFLAQKKRHPAAVPEKSSPAPVVSDFRFAGHLLPEIHCARQGGAVPRDDHLGLHGFNSQANSTDGTCPDFLPTTLRAVSGLMNAGLASREIHHGARSCRSA